MKRRIDQPLPKTREAWVEEVRELLVTIKFHRYAQQPEVALPCEIVQRHLTAVERGMVGPQWFTSSYGFYNTLLKRLRSVADQLD